MDDITYVVIDEKVEEESVAQIVGHEIPNRDNFKCSHHPEYKIEALYMNDTNTLCLCCIKCFIEDPGLTRKHKIIPFKELFFKCTEAPVPSGSMEVDEEEEVESTLMEIMIKNYKKHYNQHYESQHNAVTSEIEQVIEGLNKVKEKFSHDIKTRKTEMELKIDDLRSQMATLSYKIKIKGSESKKFGCVNDIFTKMGALHTKEETLDFFKQIYDKARSNLREAENKEKKKSMSKVMEDLKEEVERLKEQEFDTSILKDIKLKVENLLKADHFPLKGLVTDLSSLINNVELSIPEVSRKPKHSSKPKSITPFSFEFEDEDFADEAYSPKLKPKNGRKHKKISPSTQHSSGEKFFGEGEELRLTLNRKITGYLVFKNTIMGELKGLEKGMHINHLVGDKWKKLTRGEKENYEDFANTQRKVIKKEIEDARQQEDAFDSLEALSMKVKKLKKE